MSLKEGVLFSEVEVRYSEVIIREKITLPVFINFYIVSLTQSDIYLYIEALMLVRSLNE